MVSNLNAETNATLSGKDSATVAVIDNATGATLLSCTANATSCGSEQPLDEEHIIGRQVAEAMSLDYPIPMSWGHMEHTTLDRFEAGSREDEKLEVTLHHRVCKACNGGWMRKLDESMIEFMRPALKRHGTVGLTENKQRVLARWATKVALLLGVWMHDEPRLATRPRMWVPPDNFPVLHKHHGCPKHTRVWMAAMADIPVSELFATGRRIAVAGGPTGYWVMFKLKRLVFYVTGVEVGYAGPVPDRNPERFVASGALVPIWTQASHTARWPPRVQLSPEGAGGVVQAAKDWG